MLENLGFDDLLVEESSPVNPALKAGHEGLMNKNFLTTSGVLIAAGTGVAGGALLVTAFPAQILGAAAISGGLLYAGDRMDKGLPPVPGQAKPAEAKPAEATPAPAAVPA